jgi:two-component system response regulator YesN
LYRVIVVDDEPEFRRWLRSLLENSEDFRVIGEAGSGTEAVHLVASLLPDLVIADIYIPEPDGLEVAQYVQQHFPDIKAILFSAQEERVYQRLAREEGALAFIPKARLSIEALRQSLQGEG